VAVRSYLLIIFANCVICFNLNWVRASAFGVVLSIVPPNLADPGIPVTPMTAADSTASAKQRFKQQNTPRWNFVRRLDNIEGYLLELEVTRMQEAAERKQEAAERKQEVAEMRKEAVRMESKMDLMFAGSITFNVITTFLTAYYLRDNEVLKQDA
jgi:hypothetical protein